MKVRMCSQSLLNARQFLQGVVEKCQNMSPIQVKGELKLKLLIARDGSDREVVFGICSGVDEKVTRVFLFFII